MAALRTRRKEVVLADKYFGDLYFQTGLEEHGDYIFAAGVVFDMAFKPALIMDQNRALEAVAARDWLFRTEYDGVVNCLEVLWHLSLMMSDQCVCTLKYGDPRDAFWEIWCNLGLDLYDGVDYGTKEEVGYLIDCWVSRRYLRDGKGGCFPLRKPRRKDQRKVELWYQMSEYLGENDMIEG